MARSFGSRRPAGSFSAPSGGGAPASWGGGSGSSPGGISIPSGAGGAAIGGAPTARSATASAAGAVYTVTRLLGSTSTLALASGSSSNLSLNTTTGVITAASAIAVGATQIAKITETLGDLRVDYPVNITGVSATPTPSPTPTPTPSLTISGTPAAATVGSSDTFAPTISGGTPPYTLSLLSGTLPPGRTVNGSAGTVTGTYTTAGTYSYVLRATDAANATADLTVNLTVSAAAATAIQITSSATGTTPEEQVYAIQLKANQAVTFAKRTGADTASFNLVQSTVPSDTAVLTLPGQDFEAGKTSFVANLTASAPDVSAVDFTHTVTVTDVAEAAANTVGIYAGSGASSLTYAEATYPPAMYDAASNQTLFSVERYNPTTLKRRSALFIHDHATGLSTGPYDAFDQRETADDHGCPSICKCNGYIFMFGGTHNEETYWARTIVQNDNKSGFTRLPDILPEVAGDGYDYWHPVVVGKRIYLFTRQLISSATRHLVSLHIIDVADDGTATVTPKGNILHLSTDSRAYMGVPIYENDSVAIPLIRANQADEFRRDIYIFRYRFADGFIGNMAGTFWTNTFPVDKPTADANLRVVNQTATDTYGTIPQLQKGADGTIHLTYADGANGDTLGVVSLPLMHRSWTGTEFGPATQVATLKNRYDTHTLVPLSNGDLEVYFTSQNAALSFTRDGDVSVVRRVNGVWGSATKVAASSGAYGLGRMVTVKDGLPELRVIFSEGGFAPGNGTSGGSENATVGVLRGFAVGVGAVPFGFSPRPETQAFVARMQQQPTRQWLEYYDSLMRALVEGDLWSETDMFTCMAAHSEQASLLNMRQDKYNMTPNGGATFEAQRGWQGDGTSGWLRTGYVPSAGEGKYGANAQTMGFYSLTPGSFGGHEGGTLFNTAGGAETYMNIKAASDKFSLRNPAASGGGIISATTTDGRGSLFGRRAAGATGSIAVLDGKQAGSSSAAFAPFAAGNELIFLRHNTVYSSRRIGFAFIGGNLGIDHLAILHRAMRRHLIAVGAIVAS